MDAELDLNCVSASRPDEASPFFIGDLLVIGDADNG